MKKILSLLLVVLMQLTAFSSIGFAESTLPSPINVEVKAASDTAVTLAFGAATTVTYYSNYKIYLNDSATEYSNVVFYKYTADADPIKLRRIITIRGLTPATSYSIKIVAYQGEVAADPVTVTAETMTSSITTKGVNIAIGAAITTNAAYYAGYPVELLTSGIVSGTTYNFGTQRDHWMASAANFNSNPSVYAILDLGEEKVVSSIEVDHASAQGLDSGYNIRDYTINGSNDNKNWTVLQTVTNNTEAIKTVTFGSPVKYRYFKLDITRGNSKETTYNEKGSIRVSDLKIFSGLESDIIESDIDAPVNLAVSAKSDTAMALTYDLPSSGQTYDSFKVYLNNSETEHATVAADSNQRIIMIKELTPATTYSVKLVAYSSDSFAAPVIVTDTTMNSSYTTTGVNIALGAAVSSNSVGVSYPASRLTDGVVGSSHGSSNNQWNVNVQDTSSLIASVGAVYAIVDLGSERLVSSVSVTHPSAYGLAATFNVRAYQIFGSNDNENWTKLQDVTSNEGGIQTCEFDTPVTYRYFKLNITDQAYDNSSNAQGIRIGEFSIYSGAEPQVIDAPANVTVVAKSDTAMSIGYQLPESGQTYDKIDVYLNGELYDTVVDNQRLVIVKGLVANTSYEIGLKGCNGNDRSDIVYITATTEPSSYTTSGINIALGTTVTTNAESADDYSSSRLVDGVTGKTYSNLNNHWHVGASNARPAIENFGGVYAIIDLEAVRNVSKIKIVHPSAYMTTTDYDVKSYEVLGSINGTAWDTLQSVSENEGGIHQIDFDRPVSYRYFKLNITDQAYNSSNEALGTRIGEFSVYSGILPGGYVDGITFMEDENVIESLQGVSSVTAKVDYTNYDSEFTTILALYDGNDQLIKVETASVTPSANTSSSMSVTMSFSDVTVGEGYVLKSMVWDNFTDMKPYCAFQSIDY